MTTEEGEVVAERVEPSGRAFDLAATVRSVVDTQTVTGVGIATGPGSFTGLRVGASYGSGLAVSRRLPLRGLPTLEVVAARAHGPVTAVSEAGRGRVYYQPPDGRVRLGEPRDLPTDHPVAGWLRQATADAITASGRLLLADGDLRSFGEAAWSVFQRAAELPYGTVKLDYMEASERGF